MSTPLLQLIDRAKPTSPLLFLDGAEPALPLTFNEGPKITLPLHPLGGKPPPPIQLKEGAKPRAQEGAYPGPEGGQAGHPLQVMNGVRFMPPFLSPKGGKLAPPLPF